MSTRAINPYGPVGGGGGLGGGPPGVDGGSGGDSQPYYNNQPQHTAPQQYVPTQQTPAQATYLPNSIFGNTFAGSAGPSSSQSQPHSQPQAHRQPQPQLPSQPLHTQTSLIPSQRIVDLIERHMSPLSNSATSPIRDPAHLSIVEGYAQLVVYCLPEEGVVQTQYNQLVEICKKLSLLIQQFTPTATGGVAAVSAEYAARMAELFRLCDAHSFAAAEAVGKELTTRHWQSYAAFSAGVKKLLAEAKKKEADNVRPFS